MPFRLVPGLDISQSVRLAATEQIDRVLAQLSGKSENGNAVHEARKALKRLRALLRLIRPAMSKSDFRNDEARLKRIARTMSGVRDIQAMLETVAKLDAYDEKIGRGPAAVKLRTHLEAKRDAAEESHKTSGVSLALKLLKDARKAFAEITLKPDDFAVLASTIERDYRKGRRALHHAYEIEEDEAFHEWRKYVQRHWRQLLLVAPAWPKALRPQIALARDLSDILGEDHDLHVLACYIQENRKEIGNSRTIAPYFKLCRRRQSELRLLARDMGARLFAEKPSSLAARLTTYWMTAPGINERNNEENYSDQNNVIPLPH